MIFGFFRRNPVADLVNGEEIEVEVSSSENSEEVSVFVTDVVSVGKKDIVVAAPQKQKEIVRKMLPGTQVIVRFMRREEIGVFRSDVLAHDLFKDPPTIVLSQPGGINWEKRTTAYFQRRQFVRLEAALPIEYFSDPGIVRHAITNDISGSGLSIITLFPLEKDTFFRFKINLPEKVIETNSKVVRCKTLQEKGGLGKYEVAFNFVGMSQNDQDTIVRYIFDRQRELRRRGLI